MAVYLSFFILYLFKYIIASLNSVVSRNYFSGAKIIAMNFYGDWNIPSNFHYDW